MLDLEHALQKHDLGFLRIVAAGWGLELNAPGAAAALPALVDGILNHPHIDEVIDALPDGAQEALSALMQNEGRMLWAAFTRQFGDLRRMGPGRRDRERPDLKPAGATEVLWYRGLIGRDFLTSAPGSEPQEYAYIPEDLAGLLPSLKASTPPLPGRPATPAECAHPRLASSRILDDGCTLLAALRIAAADPKTIDAEQLAAGALQPGLSPQALKGLLSAASLLDYDGMPHPESTRAFLEAPRGKALAQMVSAWMEDKYFNELRLLGGLKFEGEWTNEPLRARKAILELASQAPENQWWSLSSFVDAVYERSPDFQRPAGDYDSWFIRQENGGAYLRGFASWPQVDGELVRFLITGPMHWLGLLDVACSDSGGAVTAFRLSRWAAALWHAEAPEDLAAENAPFHATPEGALRASQLASRAVRYQVARFCHWEGTTANPDGTVEYHYRITPLSLERARSQGLRPSQLLGLLRRYASPLPPTLAQALEHWEQSGTQAFIERVALLRMTTPEIMAAVRKTRAGRFLGDALNDTTAQVKPGMEEQLLAALAEAGYLAGAKLDGAEV